MYTRNFDAPLPLSLYIHIPWCVRKCPYCDFNSHQMKDELPIAQYISTLTLELDHYLSFIENKPLISIFFGGGTPSLFKGNAIGEILNSVAKRMTFENNIEITLEGNPGTLDASHFKDYQKAGINRLSLGIQSFHDAALSRLGRIHNSAVAIASIMQAKEVFNNFNLDLMYGLPEQTLPEALKDLETAFSFSPTHLSWYQLTIEPNTLFYYKKPSLPNDELIDQMQCQGQALIKAAGFIQYEVSAYKKPHHACIHNKNYWEFGDYLGIGAGAHSKLTNHQDGTVVRFSQIKHPKQYLSEGGKKIPEFNFLTDQDLIFEFMLNGLRLTEGICTDLFTERTGLTLEAVKQIGDVAKARGLLELSENRWQPTQLGQRYLNDLINMFHKISNCRSC